ncbi:uncharacterized protein N7484_007352 [Penicillium longicatenatum]|uniref:uncharacterized protein n=1 Tax=Penicillium longicatenatum TaxID=1561947 RepID=UPI0025472E3A|nr:uncharacterized protein N7484_007352 [Penicillium longicatenatum]KAJ5639490.1 hypothetical protein N7484_007352 [Penicillium longicatenatum]
MADDLDDELLALAGGSDEEQSPPPEDKHDSPSHSHSSHSPRHSPMGRKGTAKAIRRPRKAARDDDEEDGEVSDTESHNSLQSAPMSESDSEAGAGSDEEDRPIFPYDKLYYSSKEKQEIMAMPEIQREELLSERAQQVDRHNQDLALRRLLASREREEKRAAAKQAKRKAGSAGLDENQRKSSRQKTTLGGRKVGETSAAIDAYKRQREQKGKRDELRRRDPTSSRRRSRTPGSDVSDEDGEAESDLELDDRVGRSPSIPKDDPPAELRDINRARVGRTNFAQVCFYPGFEQAITGCYARVNIGPNSETGQNDYRLCLIEGFNQGKPYAIEGANGRPFVTDQYAKLAHGKAVRDFPFIACSDSAITEAEYSRYRKTMAIEDIKMATQTKLAGKVADINRLINHRFTAEELSEKLRRQGALDEKRNVRKRFDLEKELVFAKANGTEEEIEKLQKELDAIVKPNLSWGTTMNKPVADKALTEAERVHLINVRNQKLNYENVRRAQLDERKAARKAAAAVARGEAVADPFMRVRTVAKTHHDVSDKPQDTPKTEEAASVDIKEIKPATDSPRGSNPNPGLTPKKKGAYMISYRNTDDENIAALDMDIDIDI